SPPRLSAGQSVVLALGLGRLADLSAADAATNCTQSRIATSARAAGSVPSGGAIPGEFGAHQVPARPHARPPISTYRVQVTMRVAYLINQYPAVSHAFIRREIQALERQGFEIVRISLRGWNNDLVDPQDKVESKRTNFVLRAGIPTLLLAVTQSLLTGPLVFMRALILACRMGQGAERGLPVHLAYLVEACLIKRWLREKGVQHLHAHFSTNSAEVAMLVHALG